MKDLLRPLALLRSYRRWMLERIALSTGVVLANVALLALSGWFITGMAMAGRSRIAARVRPAPDRSADALRDGWVWALDDIDLHVPADSRVAIVGPTGASKASLFHVLLRF